MYKIKLNHRSAVIVSQNHITPKKHATHYPIHADNDEKRFRILSGLIRGDREKSSTAASDKKKQE